MRGEAVNSFVFQMNWLDTPGTRVGEAAPPEPVGEPGHVTVAVEGVGDEVEAGQGAQLVEGPRSDAGDEVAVQRERLEVVKASEHCSIHNRDLILGQKSENNNAALMNPLLIYFFSEV